MGLLGALTLLFGVGSGVKCAAEDSYWKKQVDTLPNGVRYYIDRLGKWRLIGSDEIITPFANGNVETLTGRIVYSRTQELNNAAAQAVYSKPTRYRYAVQRNKRTKNPLTVDLNTGKAVAKVRQTIKKDGTVEYRKWYFYDLYTDIYPGQDLTYVIKVNPYDTRRNDPGVVITKEEYEAIQNCPGLNGNNLSYHKSETEYER